MNLLIHVLNRVALAAPEIAIGVAVVAIVVAPRLRMLQFEGLVLPRRKAGSR